ncbi:MAG: hypothetical protein WDN00_06985 [Limisphaerales bacterium]
MATVLLTASVYAGEFADISPKDVLAAANAKTAVIIDANGPGSYTTKGHVPTALDYSAIVCPRIKNTLIIAYCGNPGCGAYLRAAKAVQKPGLHEHQTHVRRH